jgi:surface antigen
MVTWESWAGHVAYVEAVNPDGSWVVTEMNYVAFGVISQRTIKPGQLGGRLVGFIY